MNTPSSNSVDRNLLPNNDRTHYPFERQQERLGSVHWKLLAADLLLLGVPPFVLSRVRTQSLRLAGVRIGRASAFWGRPTLVGSGNIAGRLKIGDHCGFNEGCFFDLEDNITIGSHVAVGHFAMFLTKTHEAGTGLQRAGNRTTAPVTIQDGAWLASRCTVLPGVTIGAGCVVAAGVVVRETLPDNTLFTGLQKISIAKWR